MNKLSVTMDDVLRLMVASVLITMALGGCEENPVGVANLPDARFVASSARSHNTKPPRNARLNYTQGSSWCTLPCDMTPYIQVDLGSVYIICGVATQGNSQADEWVQTYQLKFSKDGSSWSTYIGLGDVKTFQGNFDRNTVVKRLLYKGFETRFVRIYPKLYHKANCLRLEFYGLSKLDCSRTTIGVSSAAKVPNNRFSASSEHSDRFAAREARFGSDRGWAPKTKEKVNSWLQIDLGDLFFICAIQTAGHGSGRAEWTKEYKVRLSVDNNAWYFYKEGGNDRVFQGNSDPTNKTTNVLNEEARAKFIQIWPTSFRNDPTLRLEIFGIPLASQATFGLANGASTKFTMKASSGTPENGLIYGNLAWCGNSLQLSPAVFLQVDLKQKSTITGLATQGNPSTRSWVTSFFVKYSGDGDNWHNYSKNHESKMTFPGNMDQNSIRVSWFNYPLFARYIRVYPQTAHANPCLRMDLFGDRSSLKPTVQIISLNTSLRLESAELECHVHGQPEAEVIWELKKSETPLNARVNSLASGSVNGITISRLRIQSMNVSEVLEQYTCLAFSRTSCTIHCSSPAYICKARYIDGPFAVQSTVVNRELDAFPPISVKVTEVQKESITLEWKEPPLLGESILGYVVQFVEEKSYSKTSIHKGEQVTRSRNKTKLKVTNLKPGTRYRLQVATNAGCGIALYSDHVEATTVFDGTTQKSSSPLIKNEVGFGIIGLAAFLLILIVIITAFFIIKLKRMEKSKDGNNKNFQMLARSEPRQDVETAARYSNKAPEPVITYDEANAPDDYDDQDSSTYYNYNKNELGADRINGEDLYEPVE